MILSGLNLHVGLSIIAHDIVAAENLMKKFRKLTLN